jgi:GT2 family glycosyltransferase
MSLPPAVPRLHPLARPRHVVTAVLVAHDGARWLPETLQAIRDQRRGVQRFVAVDTGSRDGTRDLLERAAGAASVLSAPRRTGFGAAVDLAVAAFAHAPDIAPADSPDGVRVEWIWLLHDDSAPEPDALDRMLELADEMPSAGIIGPKLRDWNERRVLLEVGVSVDRGGRRETGLEPGELDHGQHDGDRDVLAVSTAGMLVRRDVWDRLRGLDRALPLFRDDLDFGWRANLAGYRVVVCSRAIVAHAEAAARGQRPIDAGTPYRRRLDRQAALRTLLVNSSGVWLPVIAVRLLLACLLRALAFLLLRRPYDALDEARAALSVFGRPLSLLRARSARRAIRSVPPREVARLLAPRGTRLRHYGDAISQRLATIGADESRRDERGLVRRVVTQPGFLLVVALLVIALVAERHVLTGALYGGALLPAPRGASDLWRVYLQSWHPTGFGSDAVAPPYLALVAMLATVLFGSARLAVQVLVLGSVPLAGLAAYVAARPLAPAWRMRVWLAASYALLPVVTGAVASGRLGVSVAVVLLPLALASATRALLPALGRGEEFVGRRGVGLRPGWAAAIPLAVGTAFDPVLFVLLGPLILLALLVGLARRRWLAAARALVLLVVPPLLLLPWTARVVGHPALIAAGLGRSDPGLQGRDLDPLAVLAMHPGGPGMPPVWLYVVLVPAAIAGLAQLTRLWPAILGWSLAAVGLAGGLAVSHVRVQVPGAAVAGPGGPGRATALIGAGFLMSAAVAGARLRARLATTSFGWRQPVAVVLAVAAAVTPVAAAGLWLARGTGPLRRAGAPGVLPAFVTDPSASRDQPRTIVLRPPAASDQTVSYSLLRSRAAELGDADLPPDPAQVRIVDAAVADLAGGFGDRAATALAHAGVRYVLVPVTGDGGLGATVAAAGGLVPKATDGGWEVWQVNSGAGRIAVALPGQPDWRLPETSGALGKQVPLVSVPYAPMQRLLVLTESPSPRWKADLVGATGRTPLQPSIIDGMQAFVLDGGSANVVMYREPDARGRWLVAQLVIALIVLAGALPGGPRRADRQLPDQQQADAAALPAPRDEVEART